MTADTPKTEQASVDDLIERLEKAMGPDRELDDLVAERVGYALANSYASIFGTGFCKTWKAPDGRYVGAAPKFTVSIDAALTLVPDGWRWRVEDYNVNPSPRAELAEVGQVMDYGIGIKRRAQSGGATPAIALTIAALKSRSHQ